MFRSMARVVRRQLRLKESCAAFLLLGIIIFNYPFIQIFNRPVPASGLPLPFFYLYAAWGVFILLTCLFAWVHGARDGED